MEHTTKTDRVVFTAPTLNGLPVTFVYDGDRETLFCAATGEDFNRISPMLDARWTDLKSAKEWAVENIDYVMAR